MSKPVDKNATLGRLARTDVVGLRDASNLRSYAQIEDLADERLVTQKLESAATADMAYGAMLHVLQNARLTISLKCFNWFYSSNTSKEYTTFFIRGASGASSDMKKRNEAEKQMFGYDADPVPTPATASEKAQARIQALGALTSPIFQGNMRPRYAAVDFAYCNNGGLTKYGKSYFVLREHLKHNATYCHCDSFEVEADMIARKNEYGGRIVSLNEVLATYFQLGKIILYCHPAMLKKIHAYGKGSSEPGGEDRLLGGQLYIEAQVHADIVFEQDVESLCISNSECTAGPNIHPLFNAGMLKKKTIWDAKDAALVKKHAQKFAAGNKLLYKSVV